MQRTIDGHAVVIGRAELLKQWSIRLPESLDEAEFAAGQRGSTAVVMASDGEAQAASVVSNSLRFRRFRSSSSEEAASPVPAVPA